MIALQSFLIHVVLVVYVVCVSSVLLFVNFLSPLTLFYVFWVLAGFNIFIAAYVIAEAIAALVVRLAYPPTKEVSISNNKLFGDHRLTIIIAAYLPNEQDLILETLDHYKTLIYPVPYQIILAYNTPNPLVIEEVLQARAKEDIRFKAVKVVDSTSKAENVNYALSMLGDVSPTHVISIYDADHHPARNTFIQVVNRFTDKPSLDAVQGRCIIRNSSESFIARMVDVEFDMIYNIFHVGFNAVHGHGLFGGTNGHWRSTVLCKLKMDEEMLTEDIDLAIRATVNNLLIEYDHRIESHELAPIFLSQYVKQRSRWAQGWFQVTLIRNYAAMTKPKSLWRRIGLFMLLGLREASFHLQLWLTILTILGLILYPPSYNNLIWVAVASNFLLLIMLLSACRHKLMSIVFMLLFIFYMYLQAYIVLISELKEFLIIKKWKVTARLSTVGSSANAESNELRSDVSTSSGSSSFLRVPLRNSSKVNFGKMSTRGSNTNLETLGSFDESSVLSSPGSGLSFKVTGSALKYESDSVPNNIDDSDAIAVLVSPENSSSMSDHQFLGSSDAGTN